jgi:hypothetical protein
MLDLNSISAECSQIFSKVRRYSTATLLPAFLFQILNGSHHVTLTYLPH